MFTSEVDLLARDREIEGRSVVNLPTRVCLTMSRVSCLISSGLQDLPAILDATDPEDTTVRQAIEEVLARVQLADNQVVPVSEAPKQERHQASEQRNTSSRLQQHNDTCTTSALNQVSATGRQETASKRGASTARSVLPPK